MPTTPILGITQVSASQSSKEITINDAILALESAGNATLVVSMAAGNVTLTETEASRNFIFEATSATTARELKFPVEINGNDTNRVIVVRNSSGYSLTVKFESGAGSTVIIPNNQSRLISAENGVDMTVAAEPPSVIAFISLTDVPGSYTGAGGQFLAVNIAENAIEFIDGVTWPSFVGNAGQYLVVNGTEDGVEWVTLDSAIEFIQLADAPSSYTGHAGKLVAVTGTEDGVEFIDPPEADAVEHVAAERWRIFVVEGSLETQSGYGEIEFLDINGINLVGTGTESASNYEPGFEPEFAFDDDVTSGTGWLTEESFVGDIWIEYEFVTPVTPRNVRLSPITSQPTFSPLRIRIEYYSGVDWIELGDRTAVTWVEATPQTFKINGVPLTSIPEAPNDGITYGRKNLAWEPVGGGSFGTAAYVDLDTDGTLAANSDTLVATQKAVRTYIATQVAGLWEFKGDQDCSANPNYPAALKGDAYVVTVAGKIGGASGTVVDVGDVFIAKADNAGGTQASVGASWIVLQYNIVGTIVTASSGTTFTADISVPDEAYDATNWNASVEVPTKNAIRDKIESLNRNYSVPFGFTSTPTVSEVLLIHVFAEAVDFADEWAGSQKRIGTNPAASFVMAVAKNGSGVGTITVSTGGVVTFVTTGTTVSFAAGDYITITAPSPVDTTIANCAFTLLGTHTL